MIRCFHFPAWPSQVERFVVQIEAALPHVHRTYEIRLGLVEALSNAIIHGALGLGSRDGVPLEDYLDQLEARERDLGHHRRVCVEVEIDAGDGVTITVEDPGDGFDHRRATPAPNRGIDLVRRTFESVWSARRGASLTLRMGGPR